MIGQRTILTGADQLLTLIREHRVISLAKAARSLNTDADRIKLIAESLEDQGTIVVYQTIRDVLLVEREHFVAMNGSIGVIRPFLSNLLSLGGSSKRHRIDHDDRSKALDSLAKSLAQRVRTLDERTSELDRRTEELARIEGSLKERLAQLDERSVTLDTRNRLIDERERAIARSSEALVKRERDHEKREARIASILEKARSLIR
jgi:hypothetical protein